MIGSYEMPLTFEALSPGPRPRESLPCLHIDIGDSPQELQRNALYMATHPAVNAGLVSTPEGAREYDRAAELWGVSVSEYVDIVAPHRRRARRARARDLDVIDFRRPS